MFHGVEASFVAVLNTWYLHICVFTFIHFLLLVMTLLEFPANEIVRFLVGFSNKGSQEFTVQSLEASFRYPQDFQFFIQNVSDTMCRISCCKMLM